MKKNTGRYSSKTTLRKVMLCGVSAFSVLAFGGSMPVKAQSASPQTEAQPEEIVVTAQRRSQRLLDVPYNISAVSGNQLQVASTINGNDLGNVIVGLSTVNEGPVSATGTNDFTLRGLRTDDAGSAVTPHQSVNTVATYYGDTPLFFSILMKDIERVEVLRGPQGTLYGSGAEGGAIRFIPKRPSFEYFGGEVNASGGATQHASGGNGSFDGVINIPLSDDFAIRLGGVYTSQAGYIDKVDLFEIGANGIPVRSVPSDITSGPVIAPIKHGANDSNQFQFRGAARYQPKDWLDLETDYIHQRSHADDQQYSNPYWPGAVQDFSGGIYPHAPFDTRPGGELRNTINTLEPTSATLDLVSGTASFDLGFAKLTSVTSFSNSRTASRLDGTQNYILPDFSYLPLYNNYPDFSAPGFIDSSQRVFTQETRLVSEGDDPITYVLGTYYESKHAHFTSGVSVPGIYAFSNAVGAGPTNPLASFPGANPQLGDLVYTINSHQTTMDIAGFGEITYHPTEEWQITGGFRIFRDTVDATRLNTAPFLGALFSDGVTQPISQGAVGAQSSQGITSHVFKFNTSYNITPDTKVYFTYSRGFRRGGANTVPTAGGFASLPQYQTYQPDFADNYEVGIKGRTLDNALDYSVSLYRIDLNGVQIDGFTPSFLDAVFNGKLAESQGFEGELTYRATHDLTFYVGYSYTDAKILEGSTFLDLAPGTLLEGGKPVILAGTSVPSGAQLPGVSRNNLIASVDYRFELPNNATIIPHLDLNYRSAQHSTIDVTSANFAIIPDATTVNTRITYDSGAKWTASFFVTNLFDDIGYTGTSGIQSSPYLYQKWLVSRPRTFGVDLHYDF